MLNKLKHILLFLIWWFLFLSYHEWMLNFFHILFLNLLRWSRIFFSVLLHLHSEFHGWIFKCWHNFASWNKLHLVDILSFLCIARYDFQYLIGSFFHVYSWRMFVLQCPFVVESVWVWYQDNVHLIEESEKYIFSFTIFWNISCRIDIYSSLNIW